MFGFVLIGWEADGRCYTGEGVRSDLSFKNSRYLGRLLSDQSGNNGHLYKVVPVEEGEQCSGG